MSHTLEASFNAVESPLLPTRSQKRCRVQKKWRVISITVRSIRRFSSVKEAVVVEEGVELTPIVFDAQKRLRAFWTTLCSINAFCRAKDIATENQSRLLDNPLPSPFHTVIDVKPERLSELTPVKKNVTPECLSELARHKNIEQLHQLGGVPGVASYLKSDAESGIQGDDEEIARRRHNFGSNTVQKPTPKTLPIVLETVRDPIIIILLLCATLSVCFGITRHGRRGWSDGGSIFAAVFLVIMVTATSNLWPRRQFFKLWKARDKFSVSVIRNGQQMRISVFEAVVGDIICLKTGDQVPADGLFIDGNPLQVDESCIAAGRESVEINESCNPFFLSGSKVINGSARMLVTAVGINTEWGKMLSSKSYDIEERTPLQRKLRELTIQISIVGLMVASLVLVVLLVRYFVGNMRNEDGKSDFTAGKTNIHEVCNDLIGILATPVAIAATAIPEGLLLA